MTDDEWVSSEMVWRSALPALADVGAVEGVDAGLAVQLEFGAGLGFVPGIGPAEVVDADPAVGLEAEDRAGPPIVAPLHLEILADGERGVRGDGDVAAGNGRGVEVDLASEEGVGLFRADGTVVRGKAGRETTGRESGRFRRLG